MSDGRMRNPTYLTSSCTLGYSDIAEYGIFCCSGTLTLTLESPAVDYVGLDFDVISDVAASTTIACTDGFPAAFDTVTITSGMAARIGCTIDAAGGFTWYCLGGTLG
jgi:hypothetical protein